MYGVSAVKALAAKDLNKVKIFEEDDELISDRKELLEASNFLSFENGLYELIESGECFKVIEDSVIYTLSQIIDRMKDNLCEECTLNEQIRAKDERQQGVDRAHKIIERINSQKEDQKKRLLNFMASRDSENRHSLHEYIDRCLNELYRFISADLDEKVKSYEELVVFANYYEYEPAKYYGRCISDYINGQLVPDIDVRIQNNLSHLYDEAILKVSNFVTSVSKNKENINIVIEGSSSEFDEHVIQTDFERYKFETESMQSQIKDIEANVKGKNTQKVNIEKDLESERQKANRDMLQFQYDTRRLGTDPGVKKTRIQKTRIIARTGLFAGFRDWLLGEKTETYWSIEDDYSEQNEWKKRKAALEAQNQSIQEKHKTRMMNLESRKKSLQDEIENSTKKIDELRQKIEYTEKQVLREKEIYESTLKASKQEFCDNEKRKLKEKFQNVLLESLKDTSALSRLKSHVDEVDQKNLPVVQKMVMKYYEDSIQMRLDNLNELIVENEAELETKYEISKKEMNVLDDVLKNLI